jgi:hypothetical protein
MVCENKSYSEDDHLQNDRIIASVLEEFGVGKKDQHLIWSLDEPLTTEILDTIIAEGVFSFCDDSIPGSGFVSDPVENPTYRDLIVYANQRIVEVLDNHIFLEVIEVVREDTDDQKIRMLYGS